MKIKRALLGTTAVMFIAGGVNAAPYLFTQMMTEPYPSCPMSTYVKIQNYDNVAYRVNVEVEYYNAKSRRVTYIKQVEAWPNSASLVGCASIREYPNTFNANYRILSYVKI
ncbi:hypothetical protein MJ046_17430 [Acinetobacter bereziniae]|uniref:hypothetical protein n=1 Tax=Acinetobacter bereziniae TaxID=106648 RepID=UPI0022EA293A|nr:hypothetical protein [Acinetobacter bereziniae]MDA3442118.1 hypothetical protein [Acinetobacter bereziniae]